MFNRFRPTLSVLFVSLAIHTSRADDFPKIFDTQDPGPGLTSPQDALRGMKVPEGFEVTLFAAEPDVRQPIALAMDERGRLWVAENYTYAEQPVRFETKLRDRIVILEDTDGDGQFDNRKVFWDKASKLTSIEIGFGGVWALCAPHLLFIPDRDHDDLPDGEPVVLLDGWDGDTIGHNIVNGLRWGPDGWLYGRHGITSTSYVGQPGTSRLERAKLNCAIWRYHPQRKTFEVVAQGTTNSWGMDWDDHGQMFFINTVIGHLWHVIPGAHYERMFGEHFNPHIYKPIPQTADHFHWDTTEAWHDIRKLGVTKTTDQAGGGHAHTGMMIYLGDNWPDKYRGQVFTANLHGRRLNADRLERHGATYVGRHAEDFFFADDPWFRGIELCYGPDGGVYIADWSDTGECHDNDGIHRSSGRIYKVVYKTKAANKADVSARGAAAPDLAKLSDSQLVDLQLHPNDWHVRHARRLLQERSSDGKIGADVRKSLLDIYDTNQDVTRRLRAMWCLYVTGQIDQRWLVDQLDDTNEHIRVWAIKLLVDREMPSQPVRAALHELAKRETSGLVLCFLAAALERFPVDERLALGGIIAGKSFADDPVLPLMLWYGIEPAVAADGAKAVDVAASTTMPVVRRHIARRMTYEIERQPESIAKVAALLAKDQPAEFQLDILQGMSDALRGWRKAPRPDGWEKVASVLTKSPHDRVRQFERELSLVFGDGRAMDELLAIAKGGGDLDTRRAAIQTLVASRVDGLAPTLQSLLDNRDLAATAVRGLSAYNDPGTPKLLIEKMAGMRNEGRGEVINVLVSRPAYAAELLAAVADKRIDRGLISAFELRQMQTFDEPQLAKQIEILWPELQQLSADKVAKIKEYRELLTVERLSAANASAGRGLFQKSCATCHKLFGQGVNLAPDLTGGQRSNLQYLLGNIVDPSAEVSKNYHMSILELADGRVVNGIVIEQTEKTLTLQTPQQQLVIARDEIDSLRKSELSMMPDRLLDVLTPDEVRDLIAYLMSPQQVPLPE